MEKFHEKESSKRSWPWKKKSNDRVSAAPELAGVSPIHSSRLIDDHQKWDCHHEEMLVHQYQPSPPRVPSALPKHLKEFKDAHEQERGAHDRSRAALDEARTQWKQAEERARAMNEKLANALADITTKDNLVNQHVKVAEEAVTGWEKAEAEAIALKSQLDVAMQQKLATEDRVAHLDGALKECMKQLRHVREEQEQRIHESLVKKTRDYDKLRVEMETKLAESSHFLAQTRNDLLESRAEVAALSHALQERSRSLSEMSEAKGRTETEIKVLQVRLETIEKENSQLKYEVHVLNKELEIRSEEREYERKAVDMASKQHLESVKKIAKLEEECNRLRLLVRKKLPGPAAIQRMRMEVEGIGKDNSEKSRRRSLGRSASSMEHSSADSMQENGSNENGRQTREAQLLAERVVAMDEEMKMLKESLTQRNGELQVARLMCSKTATRLSVVEDELSRAKQQNEPLKLVNGSNIQKLATSKHESEHQKQGKSPPDSTMESRRESQNFELMDDFALMERLAMTEALTESGMATQTVSVSQEVDSIATGPTQQAVLDMEVSLAAKERELGEANETCRDLKTKLTAAEKQITTLQSRNSANETSLINLQDQLDRLNEARQEQEKNGVVNHARRLSNPKGLSGYTMKDILVRAKSKSGQIPLASDASSSEGEARVEHACVSDAESKASAVHSELAIAIRKIIHIVEAFAQATGSDCHTLTSNQPEVASSEVSLQIEWEDLALDNMMRNLAHVSNKFLQGKYDLIDFVTELGTALDAVLALKPPEAARHVHSERDNVLTSAQKELTTELERLKFEKAEMESHLAEATEQIERLKTQFDDGKQLVAGRKIHDQGGESPDADRAGKEDDMIEEELMQLSSPNPALRAASGELSKMHDKVAALESELNGERHRHESVVTQLTMLQQQVRKGGHAVSSEISGLSHGDFSSHSTSEDDDDDTKSLKQRRSEAAKQEEEERQIAAAALAECQRTILALGKQLKGMGPVPEREQPSVNSSCSTESASSIQKMTENMEVLRWQTESSSSLNLHNHAPSALKVRSSSWSNPAGLRHSLRSPSPVTNGNSEHDHSSSFFLRAGNGSEQTKTRIMESGFHGTSPRSDTYSAHAN